MRKIFDSVIGHFPFMKYSGMAKIGFRFLNKYIPMRIGFLKYKRTFFWKIDGWYALWTYLTGCEPFTTKLVEELVSSGTSTFICVGANRGWFPLTVSHVNNQTAQYIFEPNPATVLILNANLNRNGIKACVFEVAISDFVGTTNLFGYEGINDGASTLIPMEMPNNSNLILSAVETKTIDSLCGQGLIRDDKETLIFLDIEGAEYRALIGSMEFLKRVKPVVISEVNCSMLKESGTSAEELFELLEKFDYETFWIHEKGHLVKQFRGASPIHLTQLKNEDSTNYIFFPMGFRPLSAERR